MRIIILYRKVAMQSQSQCRAVQCSSVNHFFPFFLTFVECSEEKRREERNCIRAASQFDGVLYSPACRRRVISSRAAVWGCRRRRRRTTAPPQPNPIIQCGSTSTLASTSSSLVSFRFFFLSIFRIYDETGGQGRAGQEQCVTGLARPSSPFPSVSFSIPSFLLSASTLTILLFQWIR